MLTLRQKAIKRIFDVVLSFVLILIFSIPVLVLIVLASIDTKQFGLFKQKRIGYKGQLFTLYKIRTLKGKPPHRIEEVICGASSLGRFLRNTKLDELPQLYNVLIGSMSLVGPRPDIAGYADQLDESDKQILLVKPGITGPASIYYKNEDKLLAVQENPQEYNDQIIWKNKVAINKAYINNWTLKGDVYYLFKSIC